MYSEIAKSMGAEEIEMMDTKMIEMEYDVNHPEERQKRQEDEDAVMLEYDDNFVTVEGLFVQSSLDNLIIDEQEIGEFTSLTRSNLTQKQFIPYKYDPEFFIKAARDLFDNVEVVHDPENTYDDGDVAINVEGIEVIYKRSSQLLECTWVASPKLDLITDAIGLLAIQLCKLVFV